MNLVRENVQKIDTVNILYAGNKVDNLSITKIAFGMMERKLLIIVMLHRIIL